MDVQVGRLAATRQTWRQKAVRDLLADVIASHPKAREDQLRSEFHRAAREDEDYFEAVCDYAFDAAMRARSQQKEPPTAADRAVALARKAEEAHAHAEKVAYIKEQIILLNQEMPNGQRARHCTLDYMFRLGGAFRRVGKKGSKATVGGTYSEAEYRKKLAGVV